MSPQRLSTTARIASRAVGKPIAQIRRVDAGQDGDKFDITTEDGEHLFCRVRAEANSQELPYQEPEILQRVNSPHVVKPTKADKIRGHYVLIRPFIEGETLGDRLRRAKLSEVEVRKLALVLFETIQALDEAGAAHFDIKPENIIVEPNGDYKLIDFGAAKFLNKMKTEKIHPARKFIAPEVLRYLFDPSDLALQRLSTFSDMYGAGAVLYACITGRNVSEFFRSSSEVLQNVPPPIRYFEPSFNGSVADLVDRLLSKEPSRRLRPEDAILALNGTRPPQLKLSPYFLRVNTIGRGSDHAQVLDAIVAAGDEVGIYWRANGTPRFPKKSTPTNLIWELTLRDTEAEIQEDLERQYERGCIALCVPGVELENSTNAAVLRKNLGAIDVALEWRRKNATHLPVLAVIPIEDALLVSTECGGIKDAYAAKGLDGIILRVCMPSRTDLDARQLKAVKAFISPWADNGHAVLFDGDLSVLPLALFGISSLVAATYPRLRVLASRQTATRFARRPDGIYVPRLLIIVSSDNVISIRRSAYGKSITNCHCTYCASGLMRSGRWDRAERRRHFIQVFPKDFVDIKSGTVRDLQQRIQQAQNDAARFPNTRLDLSDLRIWTDFLRNP